VESRLNRAGRENRCAAPVEAIQPVSMAWTAAVLPRPVLRRTRRTCRVTARSLTHGDARQYDARKTGCDLAFLKSGIDRWELVCLFRDERLALRLGLGERDIGRRIRRVFE
jgi:hypothetical protein